MTLSAFVFLHFQPCSKFSILVIWPSLYLYIQCVTSDSPLHHYILTMLLVSHALMTYTLRYQLPESLCSPASFLPLRLTPWDECIQGPYSYPVLSQACNLCPSLTLKNLTCLKQTVLPCPQGPQGYTRMPVISRHFQYTGILSSVHQLLSNSPTTPS